MYEQIFSSINKDEFLAKYWQKSPCLFKNAFEFPPEYLSADELAGFALDEDIESRLIIQHNQQALQQTAQNQSTKWSCEHGPFETNRFSELAESYWTLLVQSIDSWAPETRKLLTDFNFLPRWRFDDLMVSYATDQGGVGPHADNYDVFLIQGSGQRHWRVGCKGSASNINSIIDGLCHVDEFHPVIDTIMQPGDMLYIPPDTPHWGVSMGESIGYSVGYRSIQIHQMLALITEKLAESSHKEHFFTDLYRENENNSNYFENEIVEWAQHQLIELANQPELLSELLSRQLSNSKLGLYQDNNIANIQSLTKDSIIQLSGDVGVNWQRIDGSVRLNIEGESFDFEQKYLESVKVLASYQPISAKLFNFSSKLVDFPPVLASLVDRGFIKSIKR